MKYSLILIFLVPFLSCVKNSNLESSERIINNLTNADTDSTIYISNNIIINDKVMVRDTIFNYEVYEKFIAGLVKSNRFIFVTQDKFDSTISKDKIIISLRHDIDYDIASSIRFARREYRNGVRATYFFLNTADYYCDIKDQPTKRKPTVLLYMKKLQNEYKHEIGWHNDLVTFNVVYNVDVKNYLDNELEWLRNNGIKINGTSYHGSEYCYKYHYLNFYIWKGIDLFKSQGKPFENYDSVLVGDKYRKITRFELSDFGFKYDAALLHFSYFFADVFYFNNKRWHMSMFDWNSLKPGDKVIILTHPAFWD